MKIRTLLAAIAFIACAPACAAADSGLFVGGSVGSASLAEDFDGFDVDADSTAWRLNVGWRFNDYLAIEIGYQNFGRFEQTFDDNGQPLYLTLKADGFTLGVTGSLPLGERFSLFARSGAYFWDGDADINAVSAASPEETNLFIGAGARYALTDRLSVTLDASGYDLDGSDSTVLSAGLDYRF